MIEYGLSASYTKWITWGGSYPGMVAALARLRFPHLIYASVSSSSPLQAAVEMPGYNDVTAKSMKSVDVGGSEECLNVIKQGHEDIGEELQHEKGRQYLEKLFNICLPNSLSDQKNQEVFAGDGVVYLPVQSNDPACITDFCNIDKVCQLMTNASYGSPMERLAYLSNNQNSGKCVKVSYDVIMQELKNVKNSERLWLYQTCTEWGFYQTCNVGSQCPYTQGLHRIENDYDICEQAFGISSKMVNTNIDNTLITYGGREIQASRVLYPNGQIDPWHANGVLVPPFPDTFPLWVHGSSHHFWTHPSLPTDKPAIRKAREDIWKQVGEWLKN